MKSNTITYTYFSKITVATLAVILMASPLLSFAQGADKTNDKFCSNIDTAREKVTSKLSERLSNAQSKHKAHEDQFVQKRDEALAQLKTRRDETDAKWNQHVAELRSKVTTDTQKTAVETFVAKVESLVSHRRDGVDAAIDTFKVNVLDLKDQRSSDFDALITAYKTGIENAFDTAQSSCEGGTSAATVRTQLKTDLVSVRDTFKTNREGLAHRSDFSELRKTRIDAASSVRSTFRTEFATAKEAFRSAFKTN